MKTSAVYAVPWLIRLAQWWLTWKARYQIARALKDGYAVIKNDRRREVARAKIHNWKWFFKLTGGIENIALPPDSKRIEFYSAKRQLLFRYDLEK